MGSWGVVGDYLPRQRIGKVLPGLLPILLTRRIAKPFDIVADYKNVCFHLVKIAARISRAPGVCQSPFANLCVFAFQIPFGCGSAAPGLCILIAFGV